MKPSDGPRPASGHPLAELSTIPERIVRKLKDQWVESAEELLALAASPGGQDRLKSLLGLNSMQLEQLIRTLTDIVGESTAQAIRRGAETGGRLGALLTEEQKQRFGIKDNAKRETEHQ